MNPDNTRHIVLKINVSPDESEAIRRSCAALRQSISATGRELLLGLQPTAHRIRRAPQREGPKLGPVQRSRFPSRRVGTFVPLRL
jgi:hypothetical protein